MVKGKYILEENTKEMVLKGVGIIIAGLMLVIILVLGYNSLVNGNTETIHIAPDKDRWARLTPPIIWLNIL